jgi:hypothetical protein
LSYIDADAFDVATEKAKEPDPEKKSPSSATP